MATVPDIKTTNIQYLIPGRKPTVNGNITVPVQGKLYRPPGELLLEATCFPVKRLDDNHSEIDIYGAGIACLKGHEPRSFASAQSYNVDLADPNGKTFLLHRIIQTIVSSAICDPGREHKDFLTDFLKIKIVGAPPPEGDIFGIVKQLCHAVESIMGNPCHTIIVDFLLSDTAPLMKRAIEPPH
ncbi:hypothetical protein EV702DRAFT_1044792 [Suillus placidus]|uniref:Uncharacterized protein n=1 Tax=Suillus placidus TaxID=48579 RepID=A0A9P7D4E9_9AGAM|nr:hypothetical protein EV702DRAFT_1044792 [Suillus placidus]